MHKILVVDDQPHIIRVIRLGLEREGYQVESAGNGQEALERLQNGRYDVLITDVEMPRMSGRELCEALHRNVAGPLPYTLVLTAKTDVSIRSWVEALPATQLLEKPISLHRLKASLSHHFSDQASARDSP